MERQVKIIVDFSARVLYHVLTRHVSHDRAYQAAAREYRKALSIVPPRVLYRVSHDIVSDYHTVRHVEKYVYGATGGSKRAARLWLALLGPEKEYLQPYIDGVERLRRKLLKTLPRRVESIEDVIEAAGSEAEKLAIKYSFPTWFTKLILRLLGPYSAERLLASLNEEKWWIRVNTLKADPDRVAARLEEKGVIVRRDRDLPYMLEVVDFSEPLHHLEEMWRGEIVFQDKASAMVVEALEPEPGDVILDLAAAPGVKDTLVMQLTENRARIIAVDVSWERLQRTKRLLRMYGADTSRIEIVQADSTTLHLRLKPSKVMLDAPCTSSGAVGKDPAIKLHLDDLNWVARFPPLQAAMLETALKYRAPTVYAVCSILPMEGEEQIVKIVERGAASLQRPRIPAAHGYAVYGDAARKMARFLPSLHQTQGFFISLLEP